MQEKISVFDENNIPTGRTYYRRAKQLVARGRAAWHDGGKTAIRLIPRKNDTDKEIAIMEYDSAISKLENEELLYTAKRNVRLKRGLMWNIIAFLVAAPLIYVIFAGFLDDVLGPGRVILVENHDFISSMSHLNSMAFQFSSVGDTEASAIVAQATSDLVSAFSAAGIEPQVLIHGTTPFDAAWFFTWGAYFAWGVFILTRLALYLAPKFKRKEQERVSAEYRRLMHGALDGVGTVDLRENA